MKINIIGACNIDISATPIKDLKMYDSNPGKVSITLGGVGRNIAHNLSLLNQNVKMFTAISNDANGKLIIDSCEKLNINLDDAIITDKYSQSVYLCMNNKNGDMLVGANDMDILSLISKEYIQSNINKINDCDFLVIDTNLDEETIEYLLENVKVEVFAETVSANKCKKIANIINKKDYVKINTIKANKIEAEILGNRTINNDTDLILISDYLHSKGIKNICITLGEKGAFYSDGCTSFITPNDNINIVNATGAGDALLAGLIYGHTKTTSPTTLVKYGLNAAKITLESISAVSENMNEENINKNIL